MTDLNELNGNSILALSDLEKQLRILINDVLTNEKGPDWLIDPLNGLTQENIEKIQETLNNEVLKSKDASKNLIDYTFIQDLSNIIQKNWTLFSSIFGKKSKFESDMDVLTRNRNSLLHQRPLEEYEYHLVIGTGLSLIHKIKLWNKGAGRRIAKYVCEIFFFVLDKRLDKEIEDQIDDWISKIDFRNKKIEGSTIELSFDEGKVLITYPYGITEYSYMVKGSDFRKAYCKIVHVTSKEKFLIDKIVKISNRPFRRFDMIFEEPLNLEVVKDVMLSNGKTKFTTKLNNDKSIGYLSFLAYERGSFKWPPRYLHFRIDNFEDKRTISIDFDGNVDEGLQNIDLINVENILNYMYNKMNFKEKVDFLKSIFYPFNQENEYSISICEPDFNHNELY